MTEMHRFILFTAGKQQFAIPLESVERVIPLIELMPLPNVPSFISGAINFQEEFIPVASLTNLFQLPQKDLDLSDQLIIVNTPTLKIALWVDTTGQIVVISEKEILETSKIMLNSTQVKGVFRFSNGMVLIQDLEKLLTPEQAEILKKAIENERKTIT